MASTVIHPDHSKACIPADYICNYLLECVEIIKENEDQVARFELDKTKFDPMLFVRSIQANSKSQIAFPLSQLSTLCNNELFFNSQLGCAVLRYPKDFLIQKEGEQIKDCFIILDGEVELTHGFRNERNMEDTINLRTFNLVSGATFNEEAVTLASNMDERHIQRKRYKFQETDSSSVPMKNKSPTTSFKISSLFKGNQIRSKVRAVSKSECTFVLKIPSQSWYKLKRMM